MQAAPIAKDERALHVLFLFRERRRLNGSSVEARLSRQKEKNESLSLQYFVALHCSFFFFFSVRWSFFFSFFFLLCYFLLCVFFPFFFLLSLGVFYVYTTGAAEKTELATFRQLAHLTYIPFFFFFFFFFLEALAFFLPPGPPPAGPGRCRGPRGGGGGEGGGPGEPRPPPLPSIAFHWKPFLMREL